MKKFMLIIILSVQTSIICAQEMTSIFYDPRDGQEYETVLLEVELEGVGTTVLEWMAINLNYGSEDSYCYNNYQEYCNTFGRLYPWKEALKVCPPNWHISLTGEWELVMNKYGGITKTGSALKEGGESGLNLQPAGFGEPNGAYIDIGVDGYYWTRLGKSFTPGSITVHSGVDYVTNDQVNESHHNSVRCVKDY